MNDNPTYQPAEEQSVFRVRKKLILIICAVVLFIVIGIIVFVLVTTPRTDQTPATPGEQARSPFVVIPTEQIQRENIRIAKNPHWLTNRDFAYTFYDPYLKETVLAKTNQEQETILAESISISYADYYWSSSNLLLSHDLAAPSKAFLLSEEGQLENLNLRGFGYTWAPEGNRFFYVNRGSDGSQINPSYFDLSRRSSTPITTQLPDFTHSLWSPAGSTILLYTNTPDSENNNPYFFATDTNTVKKLPLTTMLSPLWSPSGDQLAFLSKTGLSLYHMNTQTQNTIYKPEAPAQTTTFIWMNENEILLIDSTRLQTKALLISVETGAAQEVFTNVRLLADQRIELALSPETTTLAFATEKNGLLFLELP